MSRGQSWPLDLWCQWAGARLSACGGSSLILCVLLQRAFNALCHSTHLYGRRLVLEWADSEVTLQALRRKTAEHFHGKSDGTCKEHVPLWADCRARRGAPLCLSTSAPALLPFLCARELTRVDGIRASMTFRFPNRIGSLGGLARSWGEEEEPGVTVAIPTPTSFPACLVTLPPKSIAQIRWPSPPSTLCPGPCR